MLLIVTNRKGHGSHLIKSALISQKEKKLKKKHKIIIVTKQSILG